MIEILKQQFTSDMNYDDKINRVREYLQTAVLKVMYDKGFLNNLSFVGGTALRLLYDLRRFSEDLDFSLVKNEGYDFSRVNSLLEHELTLLGLTVETRPKVENTVHSTFLKFTKLLKILGLSNVEEQKLSIKLEIDTNPPKGWNLVNTVINKGYLLNLPHFDLSSMYATKLHACFFRKFTKGRDFYDLLWYLGRRTVPNYILLNNAITQTQGVDLNLNEKNIRNFFIGRLEKIDFKAVKKDVDRFLEDKGELKLLEFDILRKMTETTYSMQ